MRVRRSVRSRFAGLAEDRPFEQADGATRPDPILKESSLSTLGSDLADFNGLTPAQCDGDIQNSGGTCRSIGLYCAISSLSQTRS